jgi:hypothetical protein
MAEKIVVAGATGNLGGRISRSLVERGATAVALMRAGSEDKNRRSLEDAGVQVVEVDMGSVNDIRKACEGAACVVSALQGLRDVVVDAQSRLLEATVAATVRRFIPSDFATDFRISPPGENRNYDLRREFHHRLEEVRISPTSIFNGVFAEVLMQKVPYLDFDRKQVGYWEDPDWRLDFTTMDDAAAYTAAASLDPATPRVLKIRSFSVTPRELAHFTDEVMKTPFQLVRLGSLDDLSKRNKSERATHPEGENEVYPAWQQAQYEHSMFSRHHEAVENDRYPGLKWTSLAEWVSNLPQWGRS